MKLYSEANVIESNFVPEGNNDFRLANNSIIFDILRNKIYKDPVGSICREIADNARDAHRAAGLQSKPIEIWMPGEYLVIKDYGPGMDPETIKNVYTVYGESTKRSDNAQGGGFGLGAKTPFAYTDSFIVETTVNGTTYTYNAQIDESQCGQMLLIEQKYTGSHSGTTIKIPIKPNDRATFRQKILWFTSFYTFSGDTQPLYHGDFKSEIAKCIDQDSDWVLFDTHKSHWSSDGVYPHAIINGIPYSLDHHAPSCSGVAFIIKTGDVDLAANRESVQYTDRTTKKLNKLNVGLSDRIQNKLLKDIDKENDAWGVFLKIKTIRERFNNYGPPLTVKWKNLNIEYPKETAFTEVSIRKNSKYYEYNQMPQCGNKDNTFICPQIIGNMYDASFRAKFKKFVAEKHPGKSRFVLVDLNKFPLLANAGLQEFDIAVKTTKKIVRPLAKMRMRQVNGHYEEVAFKHIKNKRIIIPEKWIKVSNWLRATKVYIVADKDYEILKKLKLKQFELIEDNVSDLIKGISQDDLNLAYNSTETCTMYPKLSSIPEFKEHNARCVKISNVSTKINSNLLNECVDAGLISVTSKNKIKGIFEKYPLLKCIDFYTLEYKNSDTKSLIEEIRFYIQEKNNGTLLTNS